MTNHFADRPEFLPGNSTQPGVRIGIDRNEPPFLAGTLHNRLRVNRVNGVNQHCEV